MALFFEPSETCEAQHACHAARDRPHSPTPASAWGGQKNETLPCHLSYSSRFRFTRSVSRVFLSILIQKKQETCIAIFSADYLKVFRLQSKFVAAMKQPKSQVNALLSIRRFGDMLIRQNALNIVCVLSLISFACADPSATALSPMNQPATGAAFRHSIGDVCFISARNELQVPL